MKVEYPARIEKDDGGIYFVSFPDIEEAITQGETMEEALFNAAEVLSLVLEHRLDENMEIPEPSALTGENIYMIAPAAGVQAAVLVRKCRGGRTMADLARALDTSWPAAKRLENPRNSPSLKILSRAAAALGRKLVISFEDAA